jgi:hypothetical protein
VLVLLLDMLGKLYSLGGVYQGDHTPPNPAPACRPAMKTQERLASPPSFSPVAGTQSSYRSQAPAYEAAQSWPSLAQSPCRSAVSMANAHSVFLDNKPTAPGNHRRQPCCVGVELFYTDIRAAAVTPAAIC